MPGGMFICDARGFAFDNHAAAAIAFRGLPGGVCIIPPLLQRAAQLAFFPPEVSPCSNTKDKYGYQ